MDALPELLSETLGDSTVIETVDIGGGDAVAVTPAATHVYRSDGLLSDESIETFGHETDRLSVYTKRRKSEIRLATIDSEASFTVPSKVADPIVEAMIEGVLRTTRVVEPDETILAQFRFSELTLVVTDTRIFEHVGAAVWDDDFESVEYEALRGLAFEKGSVATQVVLETENRRRRVKVPNEHAGSVRRQIQDAVFEFHDVRSLEALRAKFTAEADEPEKEEPNTGSVADADAERNDARSEDAQKESPSSESADSFVSADWTPAADQDVAGGEALGTDARTEPSKGAESSSADPIAEASNGWVNESEPNVELDALAERVETLSQQVHRQTELIESQRALIEQLVDELRRGR